MKLFLKFLFGGIFLWMIVMTIRTSLAISLTEAWPSYAANPWAIATLWDAYFGFVTFFVWVAYKERRMWARVVWFVVIMGLGNIAMSLYVLIELLRLRRDEPAEAILWRRAQ
ncbi:MAG: DUF1475 family protein [Acidobacteria bacterium]|nr:DUF1475 family protein [Acidobacteriota bacterium]